MKTETSTVRTLLTGLNVGESARWHAGRLWLANWGTGQIIAVDSDGTSEVVATLAPTIPLSIDWLPDGRLLAVSGREARLLRQEPDGTWATHADLSEVVATLAPTIPLSIDWLPDGRLLAVSGREARLLRQEPDGTWATHAD